MDGIRDECQVAGAAVVGGDVVRGDTITVSVTALGDLRNRTAVTRSGARPGNLVAVTGWLGWSAAGLAVLSRGFRSPRAFVEAHRRPEPPYHAGPAAAELGATAMTDVSDGLVADLGHIAAASGVDIDLRSADIDVPAQMTDIGQAVGVDPHPLGAHRRRGPRDRGRLPPRRETPGPLADHRRGHRARHPPPAGHRGRRALGEGGRLGPLRRRRVTAAPAPVPAAPPRVLTVAGSDSGGGAGVQADLKTMLALGVHGMSVITAVTAQNSLGVHGAWELPQEAVRAQFRAVADDIGVQAVKTGMLSSAALTGAVADLLTGIGVPVVVDPVGVSKHGDPLLSAAAVEVLRTRLLPLATVATPNLDEVDAAHRGRRPGRGRHARRGRWRCSRTGRAGCWSRAAICRTRGGGPRPSTCSATAAPSTGTAPPGYANRHTHGTGCTLASALASYLALGHDVPEAIGPGQGVRHAAPSRPASRWAPASARSTTAGAPAGTPARPAGGRARTC